MTRKPDAVTTEALLAHAGWVEALAKSLVLDPSRADDVVQAAWLEALRRPPRHGGNLRAWLA
ncbi:MAG: sigma factor, partial [Planctomycetota bacterium JB042]